MVKKYNRQHDNYFYYLHFLFSFDCFALCVYVVIYRHRNASPNRSFNNRHPYYQNKAVNIKSAPIGIPSF